MAEIRKVSETVDLKDSAQPQRYVPMLVGEDVKIALNQFHPGDQIKFHYHKGSTQTYLVPEGALTLRTRDGEAITENVLGKGECALVPPEEYYMLEIAGPEPCCSIRSRKPRARSRFMARA